MIRLEVTLKVYGETDQAVDAFARAVRDHALEHGVGLVVVETGREELDPV